VHGRKKYLINSALAMLQKPLKGTKIIISSYLPDQPTIFKDKKSGNNLG
jgi:hypothetical protein